MIMTVKPVNKMSVPKDSLELVGRNIGEKKSGFPVRKVRMEVAEAEFDQESGGSSTEEVELESPKSVANFGRKKLGGFVHSQVLRVKEEEFLLREDIDSDRKKSDCYQERHVNVVVFARPFLPCSPLSGKSANTNSLKAASH